MRFEILDNLEAFRAIAPEWDAFWAMSSSHVAFHRALPLVRFAETFGHTQSFRTILIRDGERIVLGLPLCSSPGVLGRLGNRSLVNFWTIQACVLERLDDDAAPAMRALSSAFRQLGLHHVKLDWLPFSWESSRKIETAWNELGFSVWRKPRFEAAMLDVPRDYEVYLKSLSRNLRKKLSSSERQLSAKEGLELRVVNSDCVPTFMAALEEAMQLESLSWKGQEGTAMISQPKVSEFFRDCYRDFANAGIAKLFALHAGERMIAFDLGYVMDNVYSSCKISYLPEYHRYSPGMLLTAKVFEYFAGQGDVSAIDCIGEINEATMRWPHQRYVSGCLTLSTGTFVGNQQVHWMANIAEWMGKNTLAHSPSVD